MPKPPDLSFLLAEREAVLYPLERLLRRSGVAEHDIHSRIMRVCLALAAEAWCKAHPTGNEEDMARVFAEMGVAAVKGYYDASVIMAARRNLPEGKTHA